MLITMYMCNIKPISNLTPILQVLISNRRAQGIEFIHRGISFSVQTDKEVILTAGTYGSPAILIRSGIGPADQLQRLQVRTSLILNFDLFVFIFLHKLKKMQVRTFLFYLVIKFFIIQATKKPTWLSFLFMLIFFFWFAKSACDNSIIIAAIAEESEWKLWYTVQLKSGVIDQKFTKERISKYMYSKIETYFRSRWRYLLYKHIFLILDIINRNLNQN